MVYLIHFEQPFRHARHYMGWTPDGRLEARLRKHASGHGARLLRAVGLAGIAWSCVRVWASLDRHDEARLKRAGGLSRYCPVCRATGEYHR